MLHPVATPISEVIGHLPYRLALAGGWIDQPFISRLNPDPPGSMVVVAVEPTFRFMDRSGISTSTRQAAVRLWGGHFPEGDPAQLVRQLYAAENAGKADPSGSQDMIGLIYPGINRLDYDFQIEGGVFPAHIESVQDAKIARWLEKVIHLLPVAPRPEGYSPLGERHLEASWIKRLGQTGKDCFAAIINMDVEALGASLNHCMECWAMLLPQTVRHPALKVELVKLWQVYRSQYPGAMYSGCGGGYLLVASENVVPGAFQVQIRL